MKKIFFLLLILNYTPAIYAQLNKILFNEFMQFIEAQKTGKFDSVGTDAMFYLQSLNNNKLELTEGVSNAKKQNTEKQALDSVVVQGDNNSFIRVESFSYDKAGNQLSIKKNRLYSDGTKASTAISFKYKNSRIINFNYGEDFDKPLFKGAYFYSKYKLEESRLFEWDNIKKEWKINQKLYYTYNSNDQIEHISYIKIDDTGNERVFRTIDYAYQENKITIDEFGFGSAFGFELRTVYLFNTNGEIIEKQQNTISSQSHNYFKEIFVYDEWGKIKAKKTYDYDITEEKWNILDEYFYTFNKKSKITKSSELHHRAFFNDTILSQTSYTYNENNFVSLSVYQRFNNLRNLFENISKNTYNFDKHGNLLESIYFEWNSNDNQWMPESKNTNTFNINYSVQDEVLFPDFYSHHLIYSDITIVTLLNFISPNPGYNINTDYSISDRYSHMQTGDFEYKYNKIEEVWNESQSRTFYYSTHKVKQNSNTQPNIIVYPNPAINYFTIKLPALPANTKIKMYNLNGLKVMEQPVFKDELIYINHLQSGLYYFQLYVDGDKVERTGKLMIR